MSPYNATSHATITSRALGRVIAQQIDRAHLTRQQVADAALIPLSTLARKLSGASPLRLTQVAALADVLHTSPSRLLTAAERDAQQ